MNGIFGSLSKSDFPGCSKVAPQLGSLHHRTSLSTNPIPGLCDSVLAVPATTYLNYTQKALSPLDNDLSVDDLYIRSCGFDEARSSKKHPSLITNPNAESSRIPLNDRINSQSSSPGSRARDLEISSFESASSSATRPKKLPILALSSSQVEQGNRGAGLGRIADWFQGESDPINLALLPSSAKDRSKAMGNISNSSIDSPSTMQRKSFPQATPPKPPLIGRFSFFTSKSPIPKPHQLPDVHDEFIDLDINKALFPAGPADPFSPAAFKNLVQNAEGLLSRLQAAYKERAITMRELAAEKDAQAEELAESETRAKHLKVQLDDMAAKLARQDNIVMDLVDGLAQEKQKRREEEDVRKQSVKLLKASTARVFDHNSHPESPNTEEYRRQTDGSLINDSGFESEGESVVDSVFSKSRDIISNASYSSFSTCNSPDLYLHHPPTTPPHGCHHHDSVVQHASTTRPSSCSNCQGARSSQAWGMVLGMKEENRILNARLMQLEGALDGCLDLVTQLGV